MIKKILLVDDSKTETLIITKILEDAGYAVVTAGNVAQALESLGSGKPDLILMDVVMPGQSGFQFTRTLGKSAQYAAIPIVLCSSKNQEADKVWGLRQGAKDYVTKPVDAASLLAAVRRAGVA